MSRAEAISARALRVWATHHVRLDVVEATLEDLLGTSVSIRTRRVRRLAGACAPEGAIAVKLSPADAPGTPGGAVIVEAEAALAATLVARAIKRPGPSVATVGRGPSANMAGALAAIVAAVARRSNGTGLLRVEAAGDAAALESELLRIDPALVAVSLTVLIADDAFTARALMSLDRSAPVPAAQWDVGQMARLGGTPLSVPVVACAARSTVAEVGALRRGDVFLPGTWSMPRSPAGPTGRVLLSAPSSEDGVRARIGDDGRLVLGGELEPLIAAEADMVETDEKEALLTAMGDVPVIVRVEIGEACMAAREWASLGRGDVVALARRVGEHVVLRVGGLAVARGELVEIEGEVGVRIVERLGGGPNAS